MSVGGARASRRRRFYAHARHAPASEALSPSGGFAILLDGRAVRTPSGRPLVLPHEALAEAIAGEWEAQGEELDPRAMRLTGLANTAIDGVMGREAMIIEEILRFGASDTILHRAEAPAGLVEAEKAAWDPVLAWAEAALGARLRPVSGIRPAEQPADALARLREAVAGQDAFVLTACHTMTALLGSLLLALAHMHGALDLDAAWAAAHVEEDWQWARWGEEEEARARRAARYADMAAASRFHALCADG